eukprot:1118700-Amphidinium_carterae.1
MLEGAKFLPCAFLHFCSMRVVDVPPDRCWKMLNYVVSLSEMCWRMALHYPAVDAHCQLLVLFPWII